VHDCKSVADLQGEEHSPESHLTRTNSLPGVLAGRLFADTPVGVDSCQRMRDEGVVQYVPWQLAQLLRQQTALQRCSVQQAVRMELCPVPANLHADYTTRQMHSNTLTITHTAAPG
jgi:hypothetical protein